MSVTVAQLADFENMSWGPVPVTFATVTLDSSYPSGGYGTSLGMNAAAFSLRGLTGIWVLGVNTAAAGYVGVWNTTTSKFAVYLGAGFTPSGTISAPTISITGGTGGTVAIGISSDANAAALSKTAATSRTGITGVQAPTFTGNAVAAGIVEVTAATSLATLVFTVVAFGIR